MSVILAYIRACTYPLTLITVFLYLMANAASLASNFWLADWSNSNIVIDGGNRTKHVTACDNYDSISRR